MSDTTERHEPTNQDRAALLERLGITMSATFVPWSQSRNKGKRDDSGKHPRYSLNWRVALQRDGREIIATDYSAGAGHCPAYKAPVKELGHQNSVLREEYIAWECENGYPSAWNFKMRRPGSEPIMPDTLDVVASLLMDSDAIDHPTFESWASDLGYDPDSRKAETIYRECLAIGLKLRATLGDAALAELRETFAGY